MLGCLFRSFLNGLLNLGLDIVLNLLHVEMLSMLLGLVAHVIAPCQFLYLLVPSWIFGGHLYCPIVLRVPEFSIAPNHQKFHRDCFGVQGLFLHFPIHRVFHEMDFPAKFL